MSPESPERRVNPADGRIWTRLPDLSFPFEALAIVAIYDSQGSPATTERRMGLHDWTTWELAP